MAKTEEGSVKQLVKRLLEAYEPDVYYEMHVPGGWGKSGVDFNVVARGRALYIETKRPGKELTGLQRVRLLSAWRAGAACYVIHGSVGLDALERWLVRAGCKRRHPTG